MKRIFCLLLTLVFVCALVFPAAAENIPDLVRDKTATLGEAERVRLKNKAEAIYNEAEFAVVTLITDESLDSDTCISYLEDEDCGYGDDNDGLLLVVDFGDGTVSIFTNGLGDDLFDDDTCDSVRDAFFAAYNETEFLYDGLNAFYTACAEYLDVDLSASPSSSSSASDNCPEDLLELTGTGKLSSHVVDRANLLSASEEQALNARIDKIISKYGLDVVILTENAIGGYRPQLYADWFFLNHECGVGAAQDGVLFLLSMKDRDWYLCTHGKGIRIFTDYGINEVLGESSMISHFSEKEYYEGFDGFLDLTEDFCGAESSGTPYDTNHRYHTSKETLKFVGIAFVVSLIISLVIVSGFKKQLKTARPQRAAQSYVVPGSLDLRTQKDLFLYSSVSRVEKPKNTSSGGGSSTHSTGGSSFGGGGGKF